MSYRVRLTVTVIIFLLLPTQISFAQQDYTFEHFDIDNGLPRSKVTYILKDKIGYLWIGTDYCLYKFDGYEFKTYLQGTAANQIIDNILEDRSGTLWVGTPKGLNKYNRITDSFSLYALPMDTSALKSIYEAIGIKSLCENRNGNLWVGTRSGLYNFNTEKGTFNLIKGKQGQPNALNGKSIGVIYQDKTGNLWIGTGGYKSKNGGLFFFDPSSGIIKHFVHDPSNPKSLAENWVTAIYQDKPGNLWIGTNGGLDKFDFTNQTFIHFKHNDHNANSLSSNAVKCISEDDDGNLFIGTWDGGLNRYNPKVEKFSSYSLNNNRNENKNVNVSSLFADHSGIIWLGTYGEGLYKIVTQSKSFFRAQNSVINMERIRNLLKGLSINAIYRDNRGIIWIESSDGVKSINPDLSIGSAFLNGIPGLDIMGNSIFKDKTDKLWVGKVQGLYLIDLKTKKIIRYIHDPADSNSISDNQITSIAEDNNGVIWLGTFDHGIEKYERNNGTFKHFLLNSPESTPPAFKDQAVWSIFVDSRGFLWIGAYKGLAIFDPSNETFKWYIPHSNDVSSQWYYYVFDFLEDHNGVIWLATVEGLVRFDRKSDIFTFYGKDNNLADEIVEALLEDKHGNIWLSTTTGISMFSPQTKKFRNFGKRYGLNKSYNSTAFKDSEGNFYFGNSTGISIFNPDSLYSDDPPPPVVLTDFKFSDRSAQLDSSISVKKNIELNYQQNQFSIEFSALNFINSSQNQYAYKLEGYDKDWINCGTRRQVTYMNLDYGTYTFRVIGSNSNEVWNKKGASLTITISPPWWGTWWFKITSILLLFIAAGSTIRYVEMRRIKRKMELLEQERALEHERTRISRDMHDEIGSNLSEIAILSELAKKNPGKAEQHVHEISEVTTKVIDNVSEIVWAMNPQNDRLDNLIAHTRRFAVKYLGLTNINCRFTSPENIPGHLVSAEFRRNIFLVVKETLHNIVKHSSATEVLFVVNFSDHKLEMKIEDNGKGFSLEKSQTSGNGLSNMKKRIEDVGGAIALRSTQGKGTRIDFSARINY